MDVEEATRRFYAIRKQNDAEALCELFAKGSEFKFAGQPDKTTFARKSEGDDERNKIIRETLDDWFFDELEVKSIVVGDDVAAARVEVNATHRSGAKLVTELTDWFRFDEDGNIIDYVEFADTATIDRLVQQASKC